MAKTGGNAFPTTHEHHEGVYTLDGGMTLRDYFAAKALAGMCADATFNPNKINDFGDVAYQIADAMIEARNK